MINRKIKWTALALCISASVFAGNKDRTGQAGAGELLLNPWGRTGGVFGLNAAQVTGIEAMKCNIAGLAKTKKTEVGLAHTRYLSGTGMSISNLGVAHNLGDIGVLGVNIMSFGYGDIPITTVSSPEGGIGNYKPSFLNMSVGLGHTFSKNMSAGLNITYVNEAISNIRASAIGFDAGVQYVNGKRDNLHLGITLRNVGTNLRFSGDGFSFNGTSPDFAKEITVQSRSEKFSLPSQLNIAVAYDFYLDEKSKPAAEAGESAENAAAMPKHRLTPMFSFISNSFNSDWLGLGAEYAYKEKFMLRAAYRYETDIADKAATTTFYTGVSAGVTFQTRFSKGDNAPMIAFDYGYKPTRIASGVHVLGLRITLGGSGDDE
ncbi:MAG: PorV/PorQ family protein [Chitinophagaceae bacterium]|nr:PorV/PorQ family protein [Chitinophagaceae bacterium]